MKWICSIIFLLFINAAIAQETVDSLNIESDTTTVAKRNTFKEIFRGKPGKAAFYGLIIPGGGQIYNKRWIKVPLAWAIDGGAATWMIYNRQQYKKFDRIFEDLLEGNTNNIYNFTRPAQAKVERDKYRKQSEYAVVFMTIAHIFTLFEAYVDRHLMDFDISEDLTIQPAPTPPYFNDPSYMGLSLTYRF